MHFVVARLALMACVFSAAGLVVFVQPALTMALLPSTGAHPYLWSASQAIFQVLLLLGYVLATRISRPKYLTIPFVVAIVAAVLPANIDLAGDRTLIDALLSIIGFYGPTLVGLSMVAICGQYYLLQDAPAHNPAWLYAVSNAGTLATVLSYSFLIQPNLDISQQLIAWRWSSAFLLLIVLCGLLCQSMYTFPTGLTDKSAGYAVDRKRSDVLTLSAWFLGGFAPVGLSLTCSSYLSVEFGQHPVTWLAPFATYLGTLALSSTISGYKCVEYCGRFAGPAVLLLIFLSTTTGSLRLTEFCLHILLVTVLLCRWHGWLAAKRPADDSVGTFYVSLASGGAAAGFACAFPIPVLFGPEFFSSWATPIHDFFSRTLIPEYTVFAGSTLFLINATSRTLIGRTLHVAEGAAIGATLPLAFGYILDLGFPPGPDALAVTLAVAFSFLVVWRLRSRVTAAVAALLLIGTVAIRGGELSRPSIVAAKRTAYAQLTVLEHEGQRTLISGNTTHGAQPARCASAANPTDCIDATSYYHRTGPLGLVVSHLRASQKPLKIAAIGLGVGTVAAYCDRGDALSFFEVDEGVVELAETQFSFLRWGRSRCASLKVTLGDGRVQLRNQLEPFDLIIGDAFSSDAIPTHLLTLEALAELESRLSPAGIAAVHVSNRTFDLAPLVARAASLRHLAWLAIRDGGAPGRAASTWVIISRDHNTIDGLRRELNDASTSRTEIRDALLNPRYAPVLRDQRASILAALNWR